MANESHNNTDNNLHPDIESIFEELGATFALGYPEHKGWQKEMIKRLEDIEKLDLNEDAKAAYYSFVKAYREAETTEERRDLIKVSRLIANDLNAAPDDKLANRAFLLFQLGERYE